MENVKDLGHIGVLMGGYSSEREISLKSGSNVSAALKEKGCKVSEIDITVNNKQAIIDQIQKFRIDVAFIALHGVLGEDGVIQSILENMHIPYTGSGVQANRLVINKVLTQQTLKENNIPVPDFRVISEENESQAAEIWRHFNKKPLVVKPSLEGSSIGITIVHNENELEGAIARAQDFGQEVLVERYIDGRELTVGIFEEKPLPVIEIKPKNNFFDFTAKYQKGMAEYIIPAKLPEKVSAHVQRLALDVHGILGCRDFSRIDLMLDDHQDPFFLEANTIPGFTETSLVPMAAKHVGINFSELCTKLVRLAYEKTHQKN